MESRDALVTIAVGKKKSGKSHTTKFTLINKYVIERGIQKARPVVVLDLTGEYSKWGYKAFHYNPHEENYRKRTENIKAIKKPNVYRLLGVYKNKRVFTKDHIMQAVSDVFENFRNGLFVFEDINKFLGSNLPQAFISTLVSNRHVGLDMIMHYQTLKAIPPQLIDNAEYLRLHKTVGSVMSLSTDKFTNPEIIRIAELVIDYRMKELGDKYYYNMIDLEGDKLMRVKEEDFDIACKKYLMQTPKEYRLHLNMISNSGKKLYKTKMHAIDAVLKEKKELYL